jgi:hypothetical protein
MISSLDFVFVRVMHLKCTPYLRPSVSKLHRSLLLSKALSASTSCQIETGLQNYFKVEPV